MAGKGGKRSTSYKKGQSGNPNGAPSWTDTFRTVYNRLLAMKPDELRKYEPKNMKEKMCKDVILENKDYKEVANRVDGAPKQSIETNNTTRNVLTFGDAIKQSGSK